MENYWLVYRDDGKSNLLNRKSIWDKLEIRLCMIKCTVRGGALSDLDCIKGRDTRLVCLSQLVNVRVNRGCWLMILLSELVSVVNLVFVIYHSQWFEWVAEEPVEPLLWFHSFQQTIRSVHYIGKTGNRSQTGNNGVAWNTQESLGYVR